VKQVIQSLSNGIVELIELPVPEIGENEILVQTSCSLISSGTERMLINFGESNLLQKAGKNPERVKEVFNKVVIDGPFLAYDAVSKKLEEPIPLGYCNVGKVIKKGKGVSDFELGDRVVSNGSHAEYVKINKNLCAKIPNEVTDEDASFTILSSIGLQGIRLAKPTLGETFVVCGLGLIGLLTAQLLKANGCNVLGLDLDPKKTKLAQSLGIKSLNSNNEKETLSWCMSLTNNIGVDGFIITTATKSNSPIDIASQSCRKRGRIILIGTAGININRDYFYKKELTFKVSCSYGPGRYDPIYENNGVDYPVGFVRWTEKRNFESVLQILKQKKLYVKDLISKRFDITEAKSAYQLLKSSESVIGILFQYKNFPAKENKSIKFKDLIENKSALQVSVIGSGNYAKRVIVPILSKKDINLKTIFSRSGFESSLIAKKYNFKESSTDLDKVWNDDKTNTLFVLTRHNTHAEFIIKALKAGKNIFVEKPMCTTEKELEDIAKAYKDSRKENGKGPVLMVGFNRRFSSLIQLLRKDLMQINSPKAFTITCNAGYLDKNHWTNDQNIGGGRLIGEACHFVDLIMYLAKSKIIDLNIIFSQDEKVCPDTFTLNMKFENGSIGNINYFSNGNKKFQKERLEVFTSGRIYQIQNFQKLKAWGSPNLKTVRKLIQDKGQRECIDIFIESVKNAKQSPISFQEMYEVQKWLLFANKKKLVK
tara:strand:+ start:1439 stop:3565 length:2127 start_codon:yes stop_codon:yes gene_type:complete